MTGDEDGTEPAEDLATALSVAVRVEPELIRAVRLALFPRLGVETEADLWFSELVRSQGPAGVVFDTAHRHRLQGRLQRWLRQQPKDAPVHSLWRIIQRVHADLSPALLLEEQVTWLAVADRPDEIDDALAPALKAITQQDRDALRQWLASAWDRLPRAVRESQVGWQLGQTARPRLPARRFRPVPERAPLSARRLGDLARVLDDVRITVRRDGDDLEIDGRPVPEDCGEVPPGTYVLPVPDTAPRVLTLLAGGSRLRDEELSVPVTWQIPVYVGPGPALLRNARGQVFLLPERATAARGTKPAGRFLGISTAHHAEELLPPLRHSSDLFREVGEALGDTYVKEYLTDPSLAAVTERLRRLSERRHDGPLVVYVRGYALPGTGGGPRLVFHDSDPRRPETVLSTEALFRLATASGADQVLVLLDTVRPPGSGLGWGYPPPPMELTTAGWAGQVGVLVPHDTGWDRLFGSWLVRLLRRGPDEVPQRWGWSPRDRYITGGELMRAVASDWPGEYPSTPRNFATGVPRELLPNPRYALRDFPDDVHPAGFGEAYVREAAAFLSEVIGEVATPSEERARAVTNMLLLGPERGVEAAVALNDLADRFAAQGSRADAALAHRHAIALLRPLTDRLPDSVLPVLGAALYGLASRLCEGYRWAEARPAAEEAVHLRRRLVRRLPEQRPRLAESLHLWSLVLHGAGRHQAALDAAAEAVTLFRGLAAEDPNTHRPALAVSLTGLANRYGAVGLPHDAVQAAVSAVAVRREQAAADPGTRADLARSLHVRWYWERAVHYFAAAHASMHECVGIRRQLTSLNPEAYRPQLAESLNCLAISLADLGRVDTALVAGREAVGIHSELVAHGAVDLRRPLARSLRNLSLWLGTLDRPAEAVTAAQEAVGHYRELEAELSGLHRAELADALEMWSWALDLLVDGRPRAVVAAREAVEQYRRLFAAEPRKYRQALARSVNTLSIRLDTLGRSREAALLRAEVFTILSSPDGDR